MQAGMTKRASVISLIMLIVLLVLPSLLTSANQDPHYAPLVRVISVAFGFLLSLPILLWVGWKNKKKLVGKMLLASLFSTVLVFILLVAKQDFGSQTIAYLVSLLGLCISLILFLILIWRSLRDGKDL